MATGCDSRTSGASTRGTLLDVSRVSGEGNGAFQALGRGEEEELVVSGTEVPVTQEEE